jgi:2-haloacid dehalogenase
MIRAVVFDIGNVLIGWRPESWYDAKIGEARRRALFAAVDLTAMNLRIDLGQNARETVYETAAAHPDFAEEIRFWHDHWIEIASPLIPHSLRLMRALRAKRVPVFALTNFGADTFEIARAHYPFFDEFDRAFVSGRMGVLKPDPEIYRIVEAESGLPPEALLFADDKPENVEAARARGWKAHLFEGPEGWTRRLVDEGLLTESEAA